MSSILAVIPARSGSKGFPHKNIAKLGDKSLLELTTQLAVDSSLIKTTLVSTDSAEYQSLAKSAGAASLGLRSEALAGDTIKTVDVLLELLNSNPELVNSHEYLLLLQPTSPVRSQNDIKGLMDQIKTSNADAAVSVSLLDEPHPYKLKKEVDGLLEPFLGDKSSEIPRQQLPPCYFLTGGFYPIKIKTLLEQKTLLPKKTTAFVVGRKTVNIDSEEDFDYLKFLLSKFTVEIYGL